jgi:hypothetical protein
MRAHTTTTTKSRARRKAHHVVLAFALGVCALALPASAYADPPPYRSPEAVIAAADSSAPPPYRSPEAVIAAADASAPPPYRSPEAVIAAADSITGPSASGPATVSGSPAKTADGFDWASAAVGAGAAIALVALGGAALLTVRRRTAVSSASTS